MRKKLSALLLGLILAGTNPAQAKNPKNDLHLEAATSVGYSSEVFNGKQVSEGLTFDLGAKVDVDFSRLVGSSFSFELDASYLGRSKFPEEKRYALKGDNEVLFNLSREGKFKIGVGIEYLILKDEIKAGLSAVGITNSVTGPLALIRFDLKYFSLYLGLSALFGERTSSFDIDRYLAVQHAKLVMDVRLEPFEFPFEVDFQHRSLLGGNDGNDFPMHVKFSPGLQVAEGAMLFSSLRYTFMPYGVDGRGNNLSINFGGRFKL